MAHFRRSKAKRFARSARARVGNGSFWRYSKEGVGRKGAHVPRYMRNLEAAKEVV